MTTHMKYVRHRVDRLSRERMLMRHLVAKAFYQVPAYKWNCDASWERIADLFTAE